MTRLVLLSDVHGKTQKARDIIELHPEADRFVFLGDCAHEFSALVMEYPHKVMLGVRGNCDWGTSLPEQSEIVLGGKRILFCHGHTFGVKMGLYLLIDEAKARGCDAVFFGHTHTRYWERLRGVWACNPGAVQDSSYAIVDINDDGSMECTMCRL